MLKNIILSVVLLNNIYCNEGCIVIEIPNIDTTISSTSISTTILSTSTTATKLQVDSTILTLDDISNLQSITGFTGNLSLLYRGTRDGFTAWAFHSKCDGKANTISIIKSTINYVFGGYTSIKWDKSEQYKGDSNAYLFSLRKNGTTVKNKYLITSKDCAIYCGSGSGPTFGCGHDFHITNYPTWSKYIDSFTRCNSFECPIGVTKYSYHSEFAGSVYFMVSEIEVFQKV